MLVVVLTCSLVCNAALAVMLILGGGNNNKGESNCVYLPSKTSSENTTANLKDINDKSIQTTMLSPIELRPIPATEMPPTHDFTNQPPTQLSQQKQQQEIKTEGFPTSPRLPSSTCKQSLANMNLYTQRAVVSNVFADLTEREMAAVYRYLQKQPDLRVSFPVAIYHMFHDI